MLQFASISVPYPKDKSNVLQKIDEQQKEAVSKFGLPMILVSNYVRISARLFYFSLF